MKVPIVTDVDESDDEEGSEEGDEEDGDSDEQGSGDEEEDEEDEDDESEASSMADLDEEEGLEGEDDEMTGEIVKGKKRSSSSAKGKSKEIPFTFPCPSTIEEFEDILEDLDDEVYPTVVQRIRALHHPSLAQGNKEKLQVSSQNASPEQS
jgi:nucleolar protein 14